MTCRRLADQSGGENITQLLFGGYSGHFSAAARGRRQDGLSSQVLRGIHHHFQTCRFIVKEIAADPMNRRRRACDDRGIVDVGERGQSSSRKAPVTLHELLCPL